MSVIFFLIVLGQHGPLYRLLFDYVPGFNYFRSPQHLSFLFTFFAALASGYGFTVLFDHINKSAFYIYLVIIFIACIGLYWLSPAPPETETAYRFHSAIASDANIPSLAARNIWSGFVGFIVTLLGTGAVVALVLFRPQKSNFYFGMLLVLAFADLFFHLSDAVPCSAKGSPSLYEHETPMLAGIKQIAMLEPHDMTALELNDSEMRKGLFRIYTIPQGIDGLGALGYNRAMLSHTFLVSGFDPLELSRHRTLVEYLSSKNIERTVYL